MARKGRPRDRADRGVMLRSARHKVVINIAMRSIDWKRATHRKGTWTTAGLGDAAAARADRSIDEKLWRCSPYAPSPP